MSESVLICRLHRSAQIIFSDEAAEPFGPSTEVDDHPSYNVDYDHDPTTANTPYKLHPLNQLWALPHLRLTEL